MTGDAPQIEPDALYQELGPDDVIEASETVEVEVTITEDGRGGWEITSQRTRRIIRYAQRTTRQQLPHHHTRSYPHDR